VKKSDSAKLLGNMEPLADLNG